MHEYSTENHPAHPEEGVVLPCAGMETEGRFDIPDSIRLAAQQVWNWAREHRTAAIASCCAAALLLFVLVASCCIGANIRTLQEQGTCLANEYSAMKQAAKDLDADALQAHTQAALDASAALEHEVDSWSWGLACCLPYAGSDARIARELVQANTRLAQDAASPIADAYAELLGTGLFDSGGMLNLLALPDTPDAVSGLVAAARSSQPVIAECNARVQALGTSHFEQLQEVVDAAAQTLQELDDAFSKAESAFSALDDIGATMADLLP